MSRRLLFVLFLVAIVGVVSGCFGGGGGSTDTKIEGTIKAPDTYATEDTRLFLLRLIEPRAYAVGGDIPVSGAVVQALQLPSRTPIGPQVVTDSYGRYTIPGIPENISVVVVATKNYGTKTIRLSTYVPQVERHVKADIDKVTSIAAENLVSDMPRGKRIDQESWDKLKHHCSLVLDNVEEVDLVVGGELISDQFGAGLRGDSEVKKGLDYAAEVQAFLDRYQDAFKNERAAEMVSMYRNPAMVDGEYVSAEEFVTALRNKKFINEDIHSIELKFAAIVGNTAGAILTATLTKIKEGTRYRTVEYLTLRRFADGWLITEHSGEDYIEGHEPDWLKRVRSR